MSSSILLLLHHNQCMWTCSACLKLMLLEYRWCWIIDSTWWATESLLPPPTLLLLLLFLACGQPQPKRSRCTRHVKEHPLSQSVVQLVFHGRALAVANTSCCPSAVVISDIILGYSRSLYPPLVLVSVPTIYMPPKYLNCTFLLSAAASFQP